ncbi:MAG: DUF3750 domain-containing protein [Clostridia bacterium]
MPLRAELRCASIPFIGAFADHYWFVVWDDARKSCDRWEVWQRKDAGGASFGHVHCNLKHPDAGVGGGRMRVVARWEGAHATSIQEILSRVKEDKAYPFAHRYRPWPGPNSNTFVAWVLRQAGIRFRLPWKAIGKGYRWPGG